MDLGVQVSKNLIYFTLGNNPEYIILTKLCIDSLQQTGYNGDLLFITNMKNEILEDITYDGNIFFMDVPSSDGIGSSSNKLKVYQYENILNYNKIIFCDLDILWIKSPNLIFDLITEDKYYLADDDYSEITEKLIGGEILMSTPLNYYGCSLLTDEELVTINENRIKGVSCGFFAFNKNMLDELKNMDILYSNLDVKFNCAEQPIMNTYLWRNNLYTNKLNGIISHQGYFNESLDYVLIHFAGGVGKFEEKFDKMINHPLWN
jgi:hypothetical protein